jgi:hypothetical protein
MIFEGYRTQSLVNIKLFATRQGGCSVTICLQICTIDSSADLQARSSALENFRCDIPNPVGEH